jgi:hypothetical protein
MTLTFTRHFKDGRTDQVSMTPHALVVAGWTGRDEKALNHHIEELAAIGVPRPSSVPVFYRNAATNVVQTSVLEVLGSDTSGEVEPVIVALNDGLWIGLGSDHTDRKAETIGIALSKQLCGKVMAATLWKYEDVVPHWDKIIIRSHVTIDGARVIYQEGPLALMRDPYDLMTRYGRAFVAGTIVFCGTIGAKGGIRPASRFEMELEDPVLNRRMSHAYDVVDLPVIT